VKLKKGKKVLLFPSLLFLTGIGIWLISGSLVNNFLTSHNPVKNANLLVIEGWLEDVELKEATDIFNSNSYNYIVTTGAVLPQFYEMGMNGDLVFNVTSCKIPAGNHRLTVEAFSTIAGRQKGIFTSWINNENIGEDTTATRPDYYSFNFKINSKIDSVAIRFENDQLYKSQDLNFFIASISIDTLKFNVNDTMNYYRIKRQPEVEHRLAKTNDVMAKYVLMRYGIPEDKIISINTFIDSESRTAQTAKNTLKVLDSMFNTDTLRINILSRKFHSKRTYLAYRKYFKNKDNIGIITSHYLPDETEKGMLKNLKELMGILYIKVMPE
jgi:hypothetical protein